LSSPPQEDGYDLPALATALAGTPFAGNVRFFPTIHSTNMLAMREADEGSGYTGVTAGLDPRGFLQVRTSQGLRTVHSGGVRDE
jgi:hypothetical protein